MIITIASVPQEEKTVYDLQLLKQLGEKYRSVREGKGFSLEEAAKLAGKDRQSLHRFEQGVSNPSFIYLLKVTKALDISVSELLKDFVYQEDIIVKTKRN